jgi:hypothetical protein
MVGLLEPKPWYSTPPEYHNVKCDQDIEGLDNSFTPLKTDSQGFSKIDERV